MPLSHHLLPVEHELLPLTIARAAGVGAAVIIVPSAFGIGPDLEAQMVELAQAASIVVALDPFFREDAGLAPYDDRPRVMARIQAVDRTRAYGDLRAAIDWVRVQAPGQSVVLLGICFGGPFALAAAADGAVEGVVTWHGTGMERYLARATDMRCPMRLHFGSVDPLVPMSAVQTIRDAFADRDDVRILVHEGATHGFSHRAAGAYDANAEQAALNSLRELVVAI